MQFNRAIQLKPHIASVTLYSACEIWTKTVSTSTIGNEGFMAHWFIMCEWNCDNKGFYSGGTL